MEGVILECFEVSWLVLMGGFGGLGRKGREGREWGREVYTCLPMTPIQAIEGGLDWEGGVGICFWF